MVEKVIFNLLAVTLFISIFIKMIKKNDTTYVYILGIEFVGLLINFICIFFNIDINAFFKTIMYIFSVVIPGVVLLIEYKSKIDFPEMFRLAVAKKYMNVGDIDKSKEYVFAIINKYPQSYLGHKMLANIYEKEGKNSNAIDEYIRVTEINNKDLNMNYNIANLLNKEGKNDEAVQVLQDILKKQPEMYNATELLGEILFSQERYKEAITVYMSALKYNPANYDLYYNLGMTCTMLNDFQRAKEFYDKAAQINSLMYNTKLTLGQIAIICGELDEAEKYFNESIKGEDVEAGSYYYLSQIALLKGDKEKAINYMNIAVSLDPKIYNKVQKETVFLPIKKEIKKPIEENKRGRKGNELSEKERKVMNHLDKTCNLVGSLNNNDVKMMTNMRKREKQEKEKQRGK